MKKLFLIQFLIVLLANFANAQWVNNGAEIYLNKGAVLTTNDNVYHENGTIVNNGMWIMKKNWVNNANNTAFNSLSSGEVVFDGANISISGNQKTTFPHLTFVGNNVYQLKSTIEASLGLDLTDAEIKIQNSQSIILSNPENTALKRKNGFINTLSNQDYFVRYTTKINDYLFPMSSKILNNKHFVSFKPENNSLGAYAVSLINKDPNMDGLNRSSKNQTIQEVNQDFYYQIKRIDGLGNVAISFYTDKTDISNGLVQWIMNNKWEQINKVSLQDNGSLAAIPNKYLTYSMTNLSLGVEVPITTASIASVQNLNFYNAFSPDGDGKNDTWEIGNIDNYPVNDVTIYDRSGVIVFKTTNYSSSKFWDGANVNAGTYIYVLRVKINNEDKYYKGSITIIKK